MKMLHNSIQEGKLPPLKNNRGIIVCGCIEELKILKMGQVEKINWHHAIHIISDKHQQ